MNSEPERNKGLPVAIDKDAVSASDGTPAFIARPVGAPVYYGFPILDDVEVDGFRLGIISDFEAEPSPWGDAFVVAPDDSRCGIIWSTPDDPDYVHGRFGLSYPMTDSRWGVWHVSLPFPMASRDDARRNLRALLPRLVPEWESWRRQFGVSY